MRLSQAVFSVERTAAEGQVSVGHALLTRTGLVKQVAAGIYTISPLLTRVLLKIEAITREELTAAGAHELRLPLLQPRTLWDESGRWDNLMVTLKDRHGRDYCLAPTAEEVVTDFVRGFVRSYRQLPLNLFQFGLKYRDEFRPRYGLLRGREFMMKDGYSFHVDGESLREEYQLMRTTYRQIFERVGLDTVTVEAESGEMGGKRSEEFMVHAEVGENDILSSSCGWSSNVEKSGDIDRCPVCGDELERSKAIEVAHVFELDQRYSVPMGFTIAGPTGELVAPMMGCYGLGITRTAAAVAEVSNDERGIVWPAAIAPADGAVIPTQPDDARLVEAAEQAYRALGEASGRVLLDDRELGFGPKAADADMVGVAFKIIVGRSFLEQGLYEVKPRSDGESTLATLDDLDETLLRLTGGAARP